MDAALSLSSPISSNTWLRRPSGPWGKVMMLKSFRWIYSLRRHFFFKKNRLSWLDHEVRRPFLLPRVKALLLMVSILLSAVGDAGLVGASLPERRPEVWELSEECDDERLRPSSAKMSSRETLRWGWVIGAVVSRFSTNRDAIVMSMERFYWRKRTCGLNSRGRDTAASVYTARCIGFGCVFGNDFQAQ